VGRMMRPGYVRERVFITFLIHGDEAPARLEQLIDTEFFVNAHQTSASAFSFSDLAPNVLEARPSCDGVAVQRSLSLCRESPAGFGAPVRPG